jgi:hypothetical protein
VGVVDVCGQVSERTILYVYLLQTPLEMATKSVINLLAV